MKLLDVEGLTAGYGGPSVIRDVSISVGKGEIVAVLGPNGAGKTTTLLAISGFLDAHRGSVHLGERDISGLAPHKIVNAGLVQVPEGRALAPTLTVSQTFRLLKRITIDPYKLFPSLAAIRHRPAGLLSGGEQQMLALARAIAGGPRVLLLDELSLGLAPLVVESLLQRLRTLADETGLGVLLVEQHVTQALAVADRAYMLLHGSISFDGSAETLRSNRRLVESSYMGEAVLGDIATKLEASVG